MSNRSRSAVREVVLGANAEAQALFMQHFGTEIDAAIASLSESLGLFQVRNEASPHGPRSEVVHMFIHSSLNALISSLHHLVSGYPIAAAHMMRHFAESAAMAFLCVDKRIEVFELYQEKPEQYPIKEAPRRLGRTKIGRVLADAIDFDPEGWYKNLELAGLADQLSHATYLSLGHQVLFDQDYDLTIGSHFDTGKVNFYRLDISRLRSAAVAFGEAIARLMSHAREQDAA